MSQVQDTNMDKKEIADEEREKMLNMENTKHTSAAAPVPAENEVEEPKPKKKIPIGGIKMPMPSFCRSKSKETCNVKIEDETKKEENADGAVKENDNQASEKQATPAKETKEKKEKKGVLDAIRIPLATVFPRKKKESDAETGAVGLASVETLDDGVTEKNAAAAGEDGMETVRLDGDDAKDKEVPSKPSPFVEWYDLAVEHIVVTGTIAAFFLLAIIIIIYAMCGAKIPSSAPIRNGKYVEAVTSCGPVEGILEDGAVAFQGIPYALPPINNRRWQPAELMHRLDHCWNGTKLAHNTSESCWQQDANGKNSGNEDCLYLDVFTPEVRYHNPLPVVVVIGAETLTGGSPGVLQPTARLARVRDMVFVRPNFRMGIFGFLAVEPLTRATHPPSSGNYGLSDIIVALQWVHMNIAHFGGDPRNVVIWGHRAGGTLVSTLIASRRMQIPSQNIQLKMKHAKVNLFSRAWISGGSGKFPMRELNEAETMNKEFLDRIHCSDAACLRKKSADEIMDAVPISWQSPFSVGLPEPKEASAGDKHEWIIRDGNILQEAVGDVWKKLGEPGDQSQEPVKIVIGTMAKAPLKHARTNDETYFTKLIKESLLGTNGLADKAIERYNATFDGLATMISDIRDVCPLLVFVRSREFLKDVHFYVSTSSSESPNVDSDVNLIIGHERPVSVQDKRHYNALLQLFSRFVWHGDVAQADTNGSNKVLLVDQDVLPYANYPNCDFWIQNNIVPMYARTY